MFPARSILRLRSSFGSSSAIRWKTSGSRSNSGSNNNASNLHKKATQVLGRSGSGSGGMNRQKQKMAVQGQATTVQAGSILEEMKLQEAAAAAAKDTNVNVNVGISDAAPSQPPPPPPPAPPVEDIAPPTPTPTPPPASAPSPPAQSNFSRADFHQGHLHQFAPKIVVVGVGGGGSNAVNNMIANELQGVDFLALNTDAQHLSTTLTENRLQIGTQLTSGLGCGANPDAGRLAAEESRDQIHEYLNDAHMVFITAGMGGGTGTGAAPVVAEICYNLGILTVGVVTKPFRFEGTHRMRLANEGIGRMQNVVDTLIMIPNQNLFHLANDNTSFMDSFAMADNVLLAGVKSITDLMTTPGLINLDFADVQSVMHGMGNAMLGTGVSSKDGLEEGQERAIVAAEQALANPLLGENLDIATARGMLVNITGGSDMTLFEVDRAAQCITERVLDENANIIFGSAYDSNLEGSIRVSVVATGIDENSGK